LVARARSFGHRDLSELTEHAAGATAMVAIYGPHTVSPSPGVQGWRQFLQSKRQMLAEFDVARTHGKSHEVETWHGVVAEGLFRRWLADFLPQRFGVTSGYIISQNRFEDERAPHFDVIVYDKLNAPILWIEEHPEVTEAGKSRAIPAEWVKGVFEVKSRFTRANAQLAVQHLLDLKPLFQKPSIEDRYSSWLKDDFFCGVIFFELARANVRHIAAVKAMLPLELPKGFIGGIILRAEGADPDTSAHIHLLKSQAALSGSEILGGEKSLLNYVLYVETVARGVDPECPFLGVGLRWSQAHFSGFAFDLVALLTGTFQPGALSSFHAMPVAATLPTVSGKTDC
jgi:hypothetical protein